MKKNFKLNINWMKLGAMLTDGLKAAAGPLVTGGGMIGLAYLAKKLDIPYQVLLDPSYSFRQGNIIQFPQSVASGLTIMPNNSVEAAIGAILEGCKTNSDYYKYDAARNIYNLLAESSEIPDDRTKSYAIMALNNIAKTCKSSYYSNNIMSMIAKIGSGDF